MQPAADVNASVYLRWCGALCRSALHYYSQLFHLLNIVFPTCIYISTFFLFLLSIIMLPKMSCHCQFTPFRERVYLFITISVNLPSFKSKLRASNPFLSSDTFSSELTEFIHCILFHFLSVLFVFLSIFYFFIHSMTESNHPAYPRLLNQDLHHILTASCVTRSCNCRRTRLKMKMQISLKYSHQQSWDCCSPEPLLQAKTFWFQVSHQMNA